MGAVLASAVADTKPIGLAREHLFAHLQEPCLQSAAKAWQAYRNFSQEYQLREYCHTALLKVDKVLQEFRPQRSASLAAFAYPIFRHAIIDELRRLNATAGHSDWSLLYRAAPLS
jgi:RNA polymerase sigma factor (sigma-70 family)